MLAHAPMGWLHPVLHRDPPCLSPSPVHPSRLVALAVTEPSPVCANYTCANQPASNEAGPVSVAPGLLQRGFNHSCSHSPEPGWSVDLSPCSCFA